MNNKDPLYIFLYKTLRTAIVKGTYPYGSKLPGKRTIADHAGVSVITAEHALSLLEEEGYIEPKERAGYYVSYTNYPFSKPKEEIITTPVTTLVSSHDDEAFSSSAIARLIRRILSEHPREILKKTEGKGLPSLRSALSNYLARSRGITADPKQIIICSGSEYTYSLIVQMLGRSRIYGIEDPSYEKIARMYRANGVRIDPLKMGSHGILTKELERTSASVLHVTPYHSYPSGVTADAAKRHEYIEWAAARKAVLIEDDYDSEFTVSSKPESTLFSLEPTHSVIYLNTFTRTISPGIRVSYMILPVEMLTLYENSAGFYASTVSTLMQMLISELLDSGEFERHINRIRRRRRQHQSTGYTQ